MSDQIAKKTAEDFRLFAGQEPRAQPPKQAAKPAAGAEPPSSLHQGRSSAAAVEAAMERAIRRVLVTAPAGDVPSMEIMARLDEMKARAAERDGELAFELRNGLPGRMRREIHEQLRPTEERLAALEQQLTAPAAGRGSGKLFASAVLFAVLAGLILAAVVIFERPLRYWGQNNLYPLIGMNLPEAQRVQPSEKKAPPLGNQ